MQILRADLPEANWGSYGSSPLSGRNTCMKIKFRNPAVYGGVHYNSGDVADVDENYGNYTCDMRNAERVIEPVHEAKSTGKGGKK